MISLVVPTCEEGSNIEQLIQRTERVLSSSGDTFELIIVDDDSSDGTAAEVQRLQAGRPPSPADTPPTAA